MINISKGHIPSDTSEYKAVIRSIDNTERVSKDGLYEIIRTLLDYISAEDEESIRQIKLGHIKIPYLEDYYATDIGENKEDIEYLKDRVNELENKIKEVGNRA